LSNIELAMEQSVDCYWLSTSINLNMKGYRQTDIEVQFIILNGFMIDK
jgi:hypothetical protein